MITEKPFRKPLTREEAFQEIERASGTQFHPLIAKAFVALQRGQDLALVLPPKELAAIRDASVLARPALSGPGFASGNPELMALAGGGVFLVGVGTGLVPLSAGGAALALVGLSVWYRTRRRVSRLTAELHETFEAPRDSAHIFGSFVDAVEKTWRPEYAAFVQWDEDGSGGRISLERGSSPLPEMSLVSWLLREAESGSEIAIDTGGELPGVNVAVALPLRRENSALVGFFVLCGVDPPPAHVLPPPTLLQPL